VGVADTPTPTPTPTPETPDTIGNGKGPDIIAFNEIEIDQTPESTVKDPAAWLDSMKDVKLADLRAPLSPELEGVPSEMWLLKACEDAGLKGYHIAFTNEKPGNYEDGRPMSVHCVIFSRFPIQEVRTHKTSNARAILEATLEVNGKPVTVFANHWKSGAGDPVSEETRLENAASARSPRYGNFARLGAEPATSYGWASP
jgi:hypothetical protein